MSRRTVTRALVLFAAFDAAMFASAQPCEPDWIRAFGGGELVGPIRALTTFDLDDQGPEGPSLIALQTPTSYVSASARRGVVRWTPLGWTPLGGNELSLTPGVGVMSSAPTYSGGFGQRSALAVFDPDGEGPLAPMLYACGGLSTFRNGQSSSAISRFDGAAWDHVGDRFRNVPAGLRLFDALVHDLDGPGPLQPALIVAGRGDTDGPPLVSMWDGSTWTEMNAGIPPIGEIFDLEVWDPDGDGPTHPLLVAAGSFFDPEGREDSPRYVAVWDGLRWQPIGTNLPNSPGIGLGMASYDDDGAGPNAPRLVVVSDPNVVEGRYTADVTLWNGGTWTTIHSRSQPFAPSYSDGPINGRAWTFDEDGSGPAPPSLFVARAGHPFIASTAAVSRWDGQAWTTPGDLGPEGPIYINSSPYGPSDLLDAGWVFDPDGSGPQPEVLVVGGAFTHVPGILQAPFCGGRIDLLATNLVASWDGQRWRPFGNGLATPHLQIGNAASLAVLDSDGLGPRPSDLYVHGSFSSAGDVSIPVRDCAGAFSINSARHANARWNAVVGWQRAGLNPDADQRLSPRRILASVDHDPDGPGPVQPIRHIAGSFNLIEGFPIDGGPIAHWNPDGSGATSLESGSVGSWESIGNLTGGLTIHALISFDPDGEGPAPPLLIAGGDFDAVWLNEHSASGAVAAWNGTLWATLDFSAGSAIVTELAVFDPDASGPIQPRLIVAGDFVHSTPLGSARDIAQYHPSSGWSPLGNGFFTGQADPGAPVRINALAIFDDDGNGPIPPALYVGGNFVQWTDGVTPIPCLGLARWNGVNWSSVAPQLGEPIGNGLMIASAVVHDLLVFDHDGPIGPMRESLFVGGALRAPGTFSAGVARWDGSQWSALGAGLSHFPYSVVGIPQQALDLEVFDDDGAGPNAPALFIAGDFFWAGAHQSFGLAKWGCTTWDSAPPPPGGCPGDADGNNLVNFADITSALTNWLMSYPDGSGGGPGDANHDGVVNFADITSVLTNFGVPCG